MKLQRFRELFVVPVALLQLALIPVAKAQFEFVTTNGTVSLTGYTGPGGDVTIPGFTNGYPVTTIGDNAFRSRTGVTTVTIPNSVTNVGNYAFYGCSNLTSLTIGANVRSLGYDAFFDCFGLTSITIPDSVTFIGGAFDGCTSLTNMILPGRVTVIREHAGS